MMATAAILPGVQQAHAVTRLHKDCNNVPHPPPCGGKKARFYDIFYRNFHATVIVYFSRLFLASEIYLEKYSMKQLKVNMHNYVKYIHNMNHTNTMMLVVFVALGITLVAGLIAIPTIENAQALTSTGGSIIGQRLQLFNQLRNTLLCSIFGCELERAMQ